MTWPLNLTWPESGFKSPDIRLKSVVFPDPLGPISPIISPWLTSPGYFTCDPNYPGPVDTSPPVPDTDTLPDIMEECKAILVPPTATDNGLRIIAGTTTDPLTYDHQGTYTVTWIYDDGNGNITTQAQNVIVMDTAPPTARCCARRRRPRKRPGDGPRRVGAGRGTAPGLCPRG